ncbi:type I methionyl aminopeptidase [Alteromonas sp. H39]|uniref:type I methionyl aminopeptidase n=1 Tax=Alteromonas sp. H39 TaxID=3389876 RepID=UPI0039E0038F
MSNVIIKTPDEVALMRTAGQLLASVFAALDNVISEGMTTLDIDSFVEDYIVNKLSARPASKGQYGYQYVLNASVNDVVCHGVPAATAKLKAGDIVNIDITLEKNGYIADSSKMYEIGQVSPLARQLVATSYQCMWAGIRTVKPGATLGDVGYAISRLARQHGYSVVRDYCGHGIGREMHEAPEVLHYGSKGEGLVLKEGMVFTIEPMINQGTHKTKLKKDGWTVITRDKKLSSQWEHTVAVTKEGYDVLTLREEECQK